MAKKAKRYHYSVGKPPHTVTVYERKAGGNLYLRIWDPSKGGYLKESLRHKDRDRAEAHAAQQHAKLIEGNTEIRQGRTTFARLLSLYKTHRTPQKSEREQTQDLRRIELWARVLGGGKDPHRITRHEWESYCRKRAAGEIDAWGQAVAEKDRRPVGPRTVEQDLRFLLAVLNWGKDWQGPHGYLLRENCCRGYELPKEKNPKRPIATDERVEAIRRVAPQIRMDVTWGPKRESVPSHFAPLFELAVQTGRRISAIRELRYSDLIFDRGPHGSIRWRADHDKQGVESVVPISAGLRQTLDTLVRERPGIGDAPLFPAPKDPTVPIDRYLPDRWLRRAERLAELEPQDGSLWHAYRRRWATVRKHLPAPDVAAAGGWAGPETLQTVYQQADEKTMYEVVTAEGQLREAQGGSQ